MTASHGELPASNVTQDYLKAIWSAPRTIDPRFQSADVTRTVASRLAVLPAALRVYRVERRHRT